MPLPFKNPNRVMAADALKEAGYPSVEAFLGSNAAHDSVVPACCKHGCEVEPDGRCEHGCVSVLLSLGVM